MKKIIFLLLLTTVVFTKGYSQAPTFTWAKANFGYVNDNVEEVAIDSQGNVIEVGFFKSSTDLTTGLGAFNLQGNILEQSPYPSDVTNAPYGDSYIVKYDSAGNLLWHMRTNGGLVENVKSVTTDNQNNIYVCGSFNSINVNIFSYSTPETYTPVSFVMKLSPTGTVLWFQKILSTLVNYPPNLSAGSQLINLKTDYLGNVYVSGQVRADSINAGSLSLNLFVVNNQYRQDCFILKYDTNGNPLWLKGIQGSDIENITKIDVDNLGNTYFSGTTYSPNLLVSSNSYPTGNDTSGTMNSSFTGKIDTNGNPVWLDFSDYGDIWLFTFNETTTDSQGNVYTVGSTSGVGLDFFAPHTITFGSSSVTIPYVPDLRRDRVLVVCKYSSTGEKLWMKASPANLYISGNGIEIDENDIVYVLGQYIVPTNFGGFTLPNSNFVSISISSSNPEYKTFVASLDTDGNISWARQTGQHYKLETSDFEVDNNGSIVIGGKFVQGNSINFDGTLLSGYINSSSFRDSYIAKFNTVTSGTTPVITARSNPFGLALDATNKLYIAESGVSNGNRISRATLTDTQPIATSLFTTGLNRPTRLKWSADNYLYTTETGSNEISRANLGIASPVMQSYFNNGLSQPMGLDVVGTKLFVGDLGSTSVKNIDTSVTPFQVNTHVSDYASDIVNDGISMYFVNNTSSNVYKANILNNDGSVVIIAEGMTKPSSLLLHNNMLYISDSTDGAIYRINPYGGSTTPQLLISGLNSPNGMIAYNNNLYIAETGANRIVTFNMSALSIIDNEQEQSLFSVAPNPTSNLLNFEIDSEIDSVEVFDVSGNLILKENSLESNSLSVSSLSSGLYFVKVTSNGKSQTQKIIKI